MSVYLSLLARNVGSARRHGLLVGVRHAPQQRPITKQQLGVPRSPAKQEATADVVSVEVRPAPWVGAGERSLWIGRRCL